jgi:cation diffusion facilitator CzcD-associated flavoprotein CzcO
MTTRKAALGQPVRTRALIIGSGFSGLGAAIAFGKAGIDYLILEKKFDVGGTWRDNTYPGCACDIPSHLYSFSFEQNPNWSKLWPPQLEIQAYLQGVAGKYRLKRNIRFGCEVERAWWDDRAMEWHVRTKYGLEFISQFLISGTGALHIPSVPDFKGLSDFKGAKFHSAEWNHDIDLTGKCVAIIGTGASAIQIVPAIVDQVANLKLFQRTPAWVMPWSNWEIPGSVKWAFAHVPGLQYAFRELWFWVHEAMVGYPMSKHPGFLKIAEWLGRWNIRRSVKDPTLRAKLTPSYSVGCKRILKGGKKPGTDYYGALTDPKSDVITEGIDHFTNTGIVTKDGVFHGVDIVVFATGFHVTDSYKYVEIFGQGGEDLGDRFNESGVVAHRGIMFADIPNMFMLMGPNTGLGHNSMVTMIEAQIRFVVQAIKAVDKRHERAIFPTWGAQNRYNDEVQERLGHTVWNTGCSSWYFDEHGKNRVLWSGTAWRYVQSVRKLHPKEFIFFGASGR